MRVLTNLSAIKEKFKGEVNNNKSETVPDQATSAQELLRKYATGQPLGFKQITPVYDEDENFDTPEFYKMSKIDRLHELQEASDHLTEKRNDYDEYVRQEKLKQEKLKKQKEHEQKQSDDAKAERSEAHQEER